VYEYVMYCENSDSRSSDSASVLVSTVMVAVVVAILLRSDSTLKRRFKSRAASAATSW
jgi:hypothetical protein